MNDERENKRICSIGDKATMTRTFTMEDVENFARLTEDSNGIHLDRELSARGLFRRPVVHGVLVASLISSLMGTELPGHGTVLSHEDITFLNPVYPGDTVTAQVEFISCEEENRYYRGTFQGTCQNQDGIVVAEGICQQTMLKRFFTVEEK